jgi:hypothetical protein
MNKIAIVNGYAFDLSKIRLITGLNIRGDNQYVVHYKKFHIVLNHHWVNREELIDKWFKYNETNS